MESQQRAKKSRIDAYEGDPVLCAECKAPLPYSRRYYKFCNRSCSAVFNNTQRERIRKVRACKNCGARLEKPSQKVFCNPQCQRDFYYHSYVERWLRGEESGGSCKGMSISEHVRRWVLERQGRKCDICGETVWLSRPIPLVIDHIDGNAENNSPDNLHLVCPNCDHLQPTWGGHNRGCGRKVRRDKRQEGIWL